MKFTDEIYIKGMEFAVTLLNRGMETGLSLEESFECLKKSIQETKDDLVPA